MTVGRACATREHPFGPINGVPDQLVRNGTIESRLDHRDGRNWNARQVDGEDASLVGQVARVDPAVVRLDAPSAEGEAEAQAGSIGASLLERAEQLVVTFPPGRPPHSSSISMSTRSALAPTRSVTVGARPGELERVLQQVSDHRGEDLSVGLDRHSVLDGHHGERDAAGVCLQRRGRREFVDEFGHEESLPVLDALGETDLARASGQ